MNLVRTSKYFDVHDLNDLRKIVKAHEHWKGAAHVELDPDGEPSIEVWTEELA